MRVVLPVLALLLVACGDDGAGPSSSDGGGSGSLTRIVALRSSKPITVDGNAADAVWARGKWVEVSVGDPVGKVKLKAAYDDTRLYLLALWNDSESSRNRYWKRTGVVEFARYEREDGFGVLWSPGSDAEAFAEQGCALYCHGDSHAIPDSARARFVDMWYWGAQQTQPFTTLRDMALRGGADRLRGDTQPEGSDNVLNHHSQFEGPRWFPLFISRGSQRLLFAKNLTEVKRSTLETKIPTVRGREIPLDVLREREGSRGDVAAKARFHKGQGDRPGGWVLEMARAFRTGNKDDQPLVNDPLVPLRFAIAVNDDGGPGQHAGSGPLELVFEAPRDDS